MFPRYHPLPPEFPGPGKAVVPAPLGGSTELVKTLWQGPQCLRSCPTLGPGNPQRDRSSPLGFFITCFCSPQPLGIKPGIF